MNTNNFYMLLNKSLNSEVFKIVHVPTIDDDGDYRQETVNSENDSGSSTLIACCIFVVIIFIAFAIFSFY